MQAGAKKFLSFWLSGGGLGLDYYPSAARRSGSRRRRDPDSSSPKQPSPERIGAGNESSSAVTGTTQLLGAPVVFLVRRVGESPQDHSDAAESEAERSEAVVTVVCVGEGEKRREDRGEDRNDGSDAESDGHGCSIPDRVRECKWGRERN